MCKRLVIILLIFGGIAFLNAAASAAESESGQTITRKEALVPMRGSNKFFTGEVTVTPLYPANNEMRSSGGSVTFQAGARSNWVTIQSGGGMRENQAKIVARLSPDRAFRMAV